ncbi:beta-amyrin 28-monooxygenase-like [Tasmannia lanceolata]|uniref:beta-amyrin 28-monooxygenase-like n=1 Tax=Tasmannia lanceolata TaxID=3420 RepID=UPI004063251F
MELVPYHLFLIALSAVALGFCFFFVFNRDKVGKDTANLPPGSFGWPIIGEVFEFLSSGRDGKPESFVRDRMEKYHRQVFKTSLLFEPMAVFCGPAGNKFLFSNENKLVVTWWPTSVQKLFPSSILTSTGDQGKQSRRLLTAFLKPEALQRYVGTMDEVVEGHMKSEWEGKGEVKAFHLIKASTFALACYLFASIEDPDQVLKLFKEFNILLKGIMQLPLNFPGTRFYRSKKAADVIRRELQLIIGQRRVALLEKKVSPTQDLLSYLLVTADESGRFMTEKEIMDNILLLLFAGHDTSTCTITLLLKYLADMPNIYDEVLREQMEIAMEKEPSQLLDWEDIKKMKYSWNVANEVLRLSPPVQGTFRSAIADITYEGFSIPKDWKIHWSVSSTHKNPNYFPEPEKFDPSRFEGEGPMPYTFVPFGGGPRMCPGNEFARLEILVFLHNVVKRFRWEAVSPNEKIQFDPMPMPIEGLPIRLQPHHS